MRALIDVVPTPEQLALFSRIKPGVEVIRGAAGSGKTTTALLKLKASVGFYLNRMRRSAHRSQVKVLVLTFNRTLRGYIAELAQQQFVESDELNLEVSTFSSWAKDLSGATNILDTNEVEQLIKYFGRDLDIAPDFAVEEVLYVLGRFLPRDIDEYLTCRRVGRGAQPRMERASREVLMESVIKPYIEHKRENNLSDWNDLAVVLCEKKIKEYDVIVIDEAQDFSSNELRAVLSQTSAAYTATMVLDTAQRIYARSGFTWSEMGVSVRPENSFLLTANYRNTRQIARFAAAILDGVNPDDDGAMPNFENASRDGAPPMLLKGSFTAQLAEVIRYIQVEVNLSQESVAFLHPAGGGWFSTIRAALRDSGVPFTELSRMPEWPDGPENVALCTMHSAKGLEFDHVIMIGLSNETIRLDGESVDDGAFVRARRLVAMAAGRARKRVILGYKPGEEPAIAAFFAEGLCEVRCV